MCGRVIVDYEEIATGASEVEMSQWLCHLAGRQSSSWNISPGQHIPILLTSEKTGDHHGEIAHWGITPPWAEQLTTRGTFNARIETVTEKPTFAPALHKQRCVIPVSGFYEWTGPKSRRIPHAIFGSTSVLLLAGLYRWWQDHTGKWLLTATILTRSAAGIMADLHDRMPVFVEGNVAQAWLDPHNCKSAELLDAISACAGALSQSLRHYPVRPLRDDGPQLIEPYSNIDEPHGS